MAADPCACFHFGLLGEKPRIGCCCPEPALVDGPAVLLIMLLLCRAVPCVIIVEKPPVFDNILF